jgi:hypothetical protein
MKTRFLSICFLLILTQCVEKNDPVPANTQLLRNTDLEMSLDSVNPWRATNGSAFTLSVSTDVYRSPSRALAINNADINARTSGVWSQTYSGEMPRSGRSLRLKAYIKGEEIQRHRQGSNVYIAIRTFHEEGRNQSTFGRFVSTQHIANITGTFDWAPLSVTLPSIQEGVNSIVVYLVMSTGMTGTVYFDDITLTAE